MGVKTVEEFIDWTKQREGGAFVYRGMLKLLGRWNRQPTVDYASRKRRRRRYPSSEVTSSGC